MNDKALENSVRYGLPAFMVSLAVILGAGLLAAGFAQAEEE
jgi:hypothetical protein